MSSNSAIKRQLQGLEAHQIEILWATPDQRFKRLPNSRKAAIHAFCWQCMGGTENQGTRKLIRDCSAPNCPLYEFRPYKKDPQKNKKKEK